MPPLSRRIWYLLKRKRAQKSIFLGSSFTLHFLCGSYHVAIWVNLKVVPFGKNVESLPIFDNEDIISNRQGLVGNMGLRGEQGKEGAPVGSLKKFEKPQLKCSYSAHCYM